MTPPPRGVGALVVGSDDPAAVDAAVAALCAERLEGTVREVLLRATGTGIVRGVALADGRRILVKLHQPREDADALRGVQRVQAHLRRHGFPCPEPLLAPVPCGHGLATAEAFVDDGAVCDTHGSVRRRAMAEALARLLELARACGTPNELAGGWRLHDPSARLWPAEAHAPLFDLHGTGDGAEWIDALAGEARAVLDAATVRAPVLGHTDWSAHNVRFAGDAIAVVHDWDSVRLRSETAIAGVAAATHTAHLGTLPCSPAPTPDEARAFVEDYAEARGRPLGPAPRAQIAAWATFVLAYTARCEHALGRDGDFTQALRTFGAEYLSP